MPIVVGYFGTLERRALTNCSASLRDRWPAGGFPLRFKAELEKTPVGRLTAFIEPGFKGQLNPHLPLKTGEQRKSGAAHHQGPCHLISSIRLYPCFPLDTHYCAASSAFHSVKGSFIPAPPAPGMLHRKRRGCQGFYEHSSAPCSPGFHCFLPCCASWVVLG